jgi:hypothetical protein
MIRTISRRNILAAIYRQHPLRIKNQHHEEQIHKGFAQLTIDRRNFASQTLLSRTTFQNKSTTELKEELHKRGIVR